MLSLKNDENVPTVSDKQKKLSKNTYFSWASLKPLTKRAGSGSVTQCWIQSSKDPSQNGTLVEPGTESPQLTIRLAELLVLQ